MWLHLWEWSKVSLYIIFFYWDVVLYSWLPSGTIVLFYWAKILQLQLCAQREGRESHFIRSQIKCPESFCSQSYAKLSNTAPELDFYLEALCTWRRENNFIWSQIKFPANFCSYKLTKLPSTTLILTFCLKVVSVYIAMLSNLLTLCMQFKDICNSSFSFLRNVIFSFKHIGHYLSAAHEQASLYSEVAYMSSCASEMLT